jgi:hypothetical protein
MTSRDNQENLEANSTTSIIFLENSSTTPSEKQISSSTPSQQES